LEATMLVLAVDKAINRVGITSPTPVALVETDSMVDINNRFHTSGNFDASAQIIHARNE